MKKETWLISMAVGSWILVGTGAYLTVVDWPANTHDPVGLTLLTVGGAASLWVSYQIRYGFPDRGVST